MDPQEPLVNPPPPAPPPQLAHLTPTQTAIAAVVIVLALWLAYKIGKVILRIVAGLLFLGLVGFGIWYLFIK